jgi:hypothetical protein
MALKTIRGVLAWAAVGRKSGKVLRDFKGHYAIYTHASDAKQDCPNYGKLRRVRVKVIA